MAGTSPRGDRRSPGRRHSGVARSPTTAGRSSKPCSGSARQAACSPRPVGRPCGRSQPRCDWPNLGGASDEQHPGDRADQPPVAALGPVSGPLAHLRFARHLVAWLCDFPVVAVTEDLRAVVQHDPYAVLVLALDLARVAVGEARAELVPTHPEDRALGADWHLAALDRLDPRALRDFGGLVAFLVLDLDEQVVGQRLLGLGLDLFGRVHAGRGRGGEPSRPVAHALDRAVVVEHHCVEVRIVVVVHLAVVEHPTLEDLLAIAHHCHRSDLLTSYSHIIQEIVCERKHYPRDRTRQAGVHWRAVSFPTPNVRRGGRPKRPLDANDWRIPPAPTSALARLDRDLKREYICLMCGRPGESPGRCGTCGGVLIVSDEYEPRYG